MYLSAWLHLKSLDEAKEEFLASSKIRYRHNRELKRLSNNLNQAVVITHVQLDLNPSP